MLMEPIILVFIKLIGTWDGWETYGIHETTTLFHGLLGGSQGQALGGSRTNTSHSRQSDMLG